MFHESTKPIDVKIHFIRDVIAYNVITMKKNPYSRQSYNYDD